MRKLVIVVLGVLTLLGGMLGLSRWAPIRDAWDTYLADALHDVSTGQITVTAYFRDSVGLYEGNEVTVLGMPVGEVRRIEPSGTKVIVELAVDDDVQIPADVGAVTVSPSVVTNRNVELTPAYDGGPTLADGAVIPLERTRTPVEIDRVIEAVDELAGELARSEGGTGVFRDATDVAARNLAGNGTRIRSAVRALAGAVDSTTQHRDVLVSLVRQVDQLTRAAASNKATITSFSKNLTQVSELFADQAPELRKALRRLSGLLDEADKLVRDGRTSAKQTLRNVRTTTGTLAENTAQLAETTDLLPLTLQNLLRAVDADAGELRVHVNPDQIIEGQYDTLCDLTGVDLPGCESRTEGPAPDMGISALLETVIR